MAKRYEPVVDEDHGMGFGVDRFGLAIEEMAGFMKGVDCDSENSDSGAALDLLAGRDCRFSVW